MKSFMGNFFLKFLCVCAAFVLNIGTVEAQYYRARAQVISEEDNTGGRVYVGGYSAGEYQSPNFTTDVNEVDESGDVDIYFYAQPVKGYEFVGWYKDEDCTILLSTGNTYNFWSYGGGYFKLTTSASEENAPINTLYAMFNKKLIDWTDFGEVPSAGEYYIYNLGYDGFLKINGTSLVGTKNHAEAQLCTLVSGGTTTISFNIDEATKYMNKNGTGIESTESPYSVTLEPKEEGNYMVHLDRTSYTHWEMYTSGSTDYNSKNESKLTQRWIFISKENYDAQKWSLYYAANAEATRGGGVKVAFENPIPEAATEAASGATEVGFINSQSVTAYFKAIPDEGYEFVGWKKSPAGSYVSFDANYSETFDAVSTESASPTTLTMYAYFEKESEYEAELLDTYGNSSTGTFAEKYAAAGNGYTLVLHQNIDLGSTPLDIDKNITINFNNRKITGSVANIISIHSGNNVTFVDNSDEAVGGVYVNANADSELSAVQVNGTLNFSKGVISCKNTSSEESAQATGLSVANSATLNLQGGIIKAEAKKDAYGLKVPSGATANLIVGAINATSESDACGVLANGTTKISWSVAVNATTTTGNNAIGVQVDDASANVTIDGGVITATAAASNAYAIQVKQSTVEIGGNMAAIATAGTATTAYAVKQEDTSVVNVQTGRFNTNNTQDIVAATAANLLLSGGYYAHSAGLSTYKKNSDVNQSELKEGTKFYTEGYRYMLSDGENPNYVVACAFGTDFTKYFGSLEDALSYANNNPKTEMTIRLELPEYTLRAGNFTIPANATLLIPYKQGQEVQPIVERNDGGSSQTTPSPFSKLIIESGTHIDVYGTIEVGAIQNNPYKQSDWAIGMPEGGCGYIYLESGSQIVLSSGGMLRAWGYVYGAGTIDVRRGAVVKELFQVLDFCGGTHFTAAASDPAGLGHRVFPLTQYFIQSIESKTTYHPGSQLLTSIALYPGSPAYANDVAIVGLCDKLNGEDDDHALFLMSDRDESEDTWVLKYYNTTTDQQVYEINNSALLGSLYIGISGSEMNTFDFDLPLTNNIQIHLLSGEMGITQRTVLLPGSEIIIDKKSTITILDDPLKDYDGALFLWDAAQWGKFVFSNFYAQKLKYSPTIGGAPTVRWSGTSGKTDSSLPSASINVKGTLDIQGALYTTDGGANIYSTDADAGTVHFSVAAAEDALIYHFPEGGPKTKRGWFSGYYTADNPSKNCTSAQLKNEVGDPTITKGQASKGDTYCYVDGKWKKLEDDGCIVIDKTDNENLKYLAKPADYVELKKQRDEVGEYDDLFIRDDHTYQSADETREFILTLDNKGNCQWWEVEDVEENDALKHCTHPDNDKYYYWGTDPITGDEMWLEKEFTVTWVTKPYDSKDQGLVVYPVDYKATPKYLGTNPSRPMTDYYTYDFIGWLPEIVPVTDDAVYVAQFQQNDRKYLITFLDEDGSVLEEALWKMGEVPAPVNEPTPSGKKLVWEPTIQAVNGEATYRATYTDIVLPAYQITFVNWDGTPLQQNDVATNTLPEYTGDTPTKPSLADVGFEFEGWTPDLAPVSENAIYTAKFREKPATYTITFKRAVGNEGVVIDPAETIQTLELGYGETPVCTSAQLPTKTSTAAEYYTLVWSPLITAVTGNATYTATGFAAHKNTCRLTVSAGANGKVALDGSEEVLSAIYEYGNTATITATATTTGYHFARWSDGNTTNPRTVTVNAAISLTAEFAINQYEITWNNEGGTLIEKTVVNHGAVPTHVAPTKATDASNTYSFAGWSPTPVAATANATYTATFNATPIEYTVRIVLNNGMSDIVYEGMHYNDEITIGTPVKASKNGVDYTFSHWTNSADENIGTTIPNVTQNEVYTAQYDTHINDLKAGNSDDANAKDLALTETGMEAQSLIVEPAGTVNITGSVTVQNFILESNGTNSGQLLGSSTDRLTVNEHAYFDLTLNAQRRTWYAVAVPWAVDAENGISIKGGRKLVLGRDFDLVYYQGNVRASQGAGYQCWKYAEDGDGDKIMHPGRLYMMYFASPIETIRFENNDDTPFNDAVTTVSQYSASESDDANWNGIANPMTYHATLAAGGATYGYYLNNGRVDEYMVGEGEPTYKLVNLTSYNAIVGKPLFIQAVNTNSITTTPKIAAAPRRIRDIEIEEGIQTVYEVTFGKAGTENQDNIFIQTVASKEDGYVLGQDLLKTGMSAKLPQLWINQYGKKLSVNTATPMNGVHEYPLTLNIPQSGDYTIAIESTQGDTEALYLIKDGNVIWNLSNGEYTASFEKGQETGYSLRTAAKAPQTATGIDEAIIDAQGDTRKVLIDNKVFIIRGDKVYSVDGQLVK